MPGPRNIQEYQQRLSHLERDLANVMALCHKQHQMLRAFRKSMDSNLPFPSLEKLNDLIKEFTSATL